MTGQIEHISPTCQAICNMGAERRTYPMRCERPEFHPGKHWVRMDACRPEAKLVWSDR